MLLVPQCCAWPRSCPSVPARGVDHRRSATMSNASLFCGTLEPARMRWECGQVRVTRLRKGSNCAGVQRCQVCAPINSFASRDTETSRDTDTATITRKDTAKLTPTPTVPETLNVRIEALVRSAPIHAADFLARQHPTGEAIKVSTETGCLLRAHQIDKGVTLTRRNLKR